MLGAIIGDIVGSRWEFDPTNDYDFELFSNLNGFTDDTVCTIAVADAILKHRNYGESLHEWCRKYPHPMGGYGGGFNRWIHSDNPQPYNSFGNGAAMRVSPVAWAFPGSDNLMLFEAEQSAACTHNHPEGIKGAQSVTIAIHDCRELRKKYKTINTNAIREGLQRAWDFSGYDKEIDINKVKNHFDETCQGTVPVAFWIISQSTGFEDAIRKAVSLGADADTLGAIVGSIAEVIWGIPVWIKKKALAYLTDEIKQVLRDFRKLAREAKASMEETSGTEGTTGTMETTDTEVVTPRQKNPAILRWQNGLGHMGKFMNGEDPMPDKREKTDASSWNCTPMPTDESGISTIEMAVPISPQSMSILQQGHRPEEMEDHWFMYCDDEYIRYFRSWSGLCVFEAHFRQVDNGYFIDSLRINNNVFSQGSIDDNANTKLFLYLINEEFGGDANKVWNDYLEAMS